MAETRQSTYVFPSIIGSKGYEDVPCITFRVSNNETNSTHRLGWAALYLPFGLPFSDSASYNSFDAGVLSGQNISDAANQISKAAANSASSGSNSDTLDALVSAAADAAANMDTMSRAALFLRQVRSLPVVGNISGTVGRATQRVSNPNTAMSFQNMAFRSFDFSFKLVPSSQEEAIRITKMIDWFRSNMYPEKIGAGGFLLAYPAIFSIQIGTPRSLSQGKSLSHYPRIASSFLVNMSASYGSNPGLHHTDGAPTDVTLTLRFQETKVLTKEEIEKLERDEAVGADFLSLTLDRSRSSTHLPKSVSDENKKNAKELTTAVEFTVN